jgi:dihydrolipoamide dehydrogenase
MTDRTCDVAIIGAGTAGLAAERSARRAGAKTLLIDDRFAGTTCATVGCMPSKLLIAAAQAAHAVRRAAIFGVVVRAPKIDGPGVMTRLRQHRDAFVAATLQSIAQIPPGICLQQTAHFVNNTTLALEDGGRISAKSIVIATGSRPRVPKMFEALGHRLLTNETIFELRDLPKSVAVIGAGSLGLELAQALTRLGVAIEVFEQGHVLAGLRDDTVASELGEILREEFSIHLGVELTVEARADAVSITWTGSDPGSRNFEKVLVATGRPPDLGSLNLASTGIALDEKGTPRLDSTTMQCGDTAIFMAGDADAQRAVLHEASAEGAIAGRNAACFPAVQPGRRTVPFSIMFTDPPLATLGAPASHTSTTGQASYADQGRAKVEARNAGLVRIFADRSDGKLTGAVLLGPGMDHIAHLFAWAIERGETASSLLELPFYHPTLEEGLKPALREICEAVHARAAPDRDDTGPPGG